MHDEMTGYKVVFVKIKTAAMKIKPNKTLTAKGKDVLANNIPASEPKNIRMHILGLEIVHGSFLFIQPPIKSAATSGKIISLSFNFDER